MQSRTKVLDNFIVGFEWPHGRAGGKKSGCAYVFVTFCVAHQIK
jgi:hypothetical protein